MIYLTSSNECEHDDEFPISKNDVLNATGKPADQVISRSWIQDFQQRFNIVARIRTGNKTLSQEQIAQSNKEMAYFLGNLKRRYDGGLDPANVENYDETHFVFDMDDGRCLDFQGSKRVTYAELSSGGEKIEAILSVVYQITFTAYRIALSQKDG